MIQSIISPLEPKNKIHWVWLELPKEFKRYMGYPIEKWHHPTQNIIVISAVEVVKNNVNRELSPHYHLSISIYPGQRIDSASAQWVLREFGLEGAEEDNHVPFGVVRNFSIRRCVAGPERSPDELSQGITIACVILRPSE